MWTYRQVGHVTVVQEDRPFARGRVVRWSPVELDVSRPSRGIVPVQGDLKESTSANPPLGMAGKYLV